MVLNQSDRKADDTRGNFLSNVAVNGQTGETQVRPEFATHSRWESPQETLLTKSCPVNHQCKTEFTGLCG